MLVIDRPRQPLKGDDFCAGGEPQGAGDPSPAEPAESRCTHHKGDLTGEPHVHAFTGLKDICLHHILTKCISFSGL